MEISDCNSGIVSHHKSRSRKVQVPSSVLPSQSTSNSGLVGVIAVSDSDHAAVDCILESIESAGV